MKPKSQVTFSVDEDFRLVGLVKKHPFLFDLQHELSKNQGVRDNVWKEISDEMQRSGNSNAYPMTILITLTFKRTPSLLVLHLVV